MLSTIYTLTQHNIPENKPSKSVVRTMYILVCNKFTTNTVSLVCVHTRTCMHVMCPQLALQVYGVVLQCDCTWQTTFVQNCVEQGLSVGIKLKETRNEALSQERIQGSETSMFCKMKVWKTIQESCACEFLGHLVLCLTFHSEIFLFMKPLLGR